MISEGTRDAIGLHLPVMIIQGCYLFLKEGAAQTTGSDRIVCRRTCRSFIARGTP